MVEESYAPRIIGNASELQQTKMEVWALDYSAATTEEERQRLRSEIWSSGQKDAYFAMALLYTAGLLGAAAAYYVGPQGMLSGLASKGTAGTVAAEGVAGMAGAATEEATMQLFGSEMSAKEVVSSAAQGGASSATEKVVGAFAPRIFRLRKQIEGKGP